jgi:hypothetical protein
MKKFKGTTIFEKRKAVIATMHGKESVIAPFFEDNLNIEVVVPEGFNTDQFGTFSGEVKRIKNPLETVREKALSALKLYGETLAIASEGSFGPHPESPFITGNEELVILVDTENNFEIIGRHFTEKTNFSHQKIDTITALKDFSERIGFPEHCIILKTIDYNKQERIYKDFKDFTILQNQVLQLLEEGLKITAETDMRAMNNPTRMEAIKQASQNLLANINSLCPKCNAPGFSIIEAIHGLRCQLCNLPTKGVKGYVYSCQKCNFSTEREKEGASFQDPTFCDYCNP